MADDKPPQTDPETRTGPRSIPHWRMIVDQGAITPEIQQHHYDGSGTEADPYLVTWLEDDPRNPMRFPTWYKWMITVGIAVATLAVTLASSAFSPGIPLLVKEYGGSREVATLTLSLYVLGFAIGPLLFAPLSELFGRQKIFLITFGAYTALLAGVCGSQNMHTVIILRFFAGSWGSSPLTNGGGVLADMFSARQRGIALAIYAAAPFLGPTIGPVAGGFLAEAAGWRWLAGLLAAFAGLLTVVGGVLIPETYAPVLLRKRAERLTQLNGKVYISEWDAEQGVPSIGEAVKTAMTRPWVLLFREPIVMILSIYMAIIYGTLYMLFGAYPIVYQQQRHWSPGISGLAFIGVLIGMIIAVGYCIWPENPRYNKVVDEHKGFAPPEARLPPSMVGSVWLPIGLFWFAWTNDASLPWAASMAAGIPFGFGMVLVFLSGFNYLIDSYTIFAASVLAANSILRSTFGAVFPLFTTYMYDGLGIHWASSIPAFLALACVPFPFLFYKYGEKIRAKSKYAAESDAFMKRIMAAQRASATSSASEHEASIQSEKDREKEEEAEAMAEEETMYKDEEHRFQRIKTGSSVPGLRRANIYEGSPYDIDRVNTRDSFGGGNSRSRSPSAARSLTRGSVKSSKNR